MYGELIDNYQGGREYEQHYLERARAQWLEETNGEICFYDWLDSDEDPNEPSEEDEE